MARGKMKTVEQIRQEAEAKIVKTKVRESVKNFTQNPENEALLSQAIQSLQEFHQASAQG